MTPTAAKVVLITGGARSGKSRKALALAEGCLAKLYVATGVAVDAEMERRIARHRIERGEEWQTIEAPLDLAAAFAVVPGGATIVVDCLTFWTSNLLLAERSEEEIVSAAHRLASLARARDGRTIFVTNEVGMGVVPESSLGRAFRDAAGRVNETIAHAADRVVLMVAGCEVVVREAPQ
jgi:adenosylcobinamide kinase/adenosylcobinamide-phosphate guanylyltransferase